MDFRFTFLVILTIFLRDVSRHTILFQKYSFPTNLLSNSPATKSMKNSWIRIINLKRFFFHRNLLTLKKKFGINWIFISLQKIVICVRVAVFPCTPISKCQHILWWLIYIFTYSCLHIYGWVFFLYFGYGEPKKCFALVTLTCNKSFALFNREAKFSFWWGRHGAMDDLHFRNLHLVKWFNNTLHATLLNAIETLILAIPVEVRSHKFF